MPDVVTHPTPQELSAFGLGKLPHAATARVARHLETCLDCRKIVEELPPDSFLGKVRAAKPGEPSVLPGQPTASAAASFAPPEDVPPELAQHPKYRIVRELGRGGMGVVYQAVQTIMDRPIAIKVINRSVLQHPDALPRFHAEVKAAAKLDHPNIVRAHDADQVGGLHLLVMEFIEGLSLAEVVQRRGPLPIAHACHYVRQAALGLQHAFEQGMVHRDIKPQNLMLTPKGVVKILDFGLARLRGAAPAAGGLTAIGAFMGTPEYVSPEQARDARSADTRADLYSLGCTLYFLLTGRPPFVEDTAVLLVLAQIQKEARPVQELRPDAPPELSAVVARLLAKDPVQRYQKPVELAQALLPFIKAGAKGGTAAALPPGVASPARGTVMPGDTSRVKGLGKDASQLPAKEAVAAKPEEPFANLGDARISAPKKETKRRAEKPGAAPAWKRPSILAGAAVAVLALLIVGLSASGVFKVKTKDGTIVLENLPADAEVTVDGDKVTLKTIEGNTFAIGIAAGKKHRLQVKKDGFTTFGEEVEINAGGRQSITVRLEPLPVAAAKPAVAAVGASPGGPLPKTFTSSLGMEFVLVPAGKFMMGSPVGEHGRSNDEGPQHEVTISKPFYLGAHAVTQGQYRQIMNGNPSLFSREGRNKIAVENVADIDNFPVETVTWNDAVEFCRRLSERAAEKGKGWRYRLPTEAEWEYACRAGTTTPFHFGSELQGTQANFGGSLGRTCPVGSYPANAWGLHEMHGNVWQWCEDAYGLYSEERQTDPTGAAATEGSLRVLRGGSWIFAPPGCRAALRGRFAPDYRSSRFGDIGFRVARVPVGKTVMAAEDKGFVPLFNGKDLTGWHASGASVTWQVIDGTLTGSGANGLLVTDRSDFENFRLRVEGMLGKGGDSGVNFRVRDGFLYEAQIGGGSFPWAKNTGSLIRFARGGMRELALAPKAVPTGQWFAMEILAEGNQFTIWVDGNKTVAYEDKENQCSRGAIQLQAIAPSAPVRFRKVEIKELSATKPEAAPVAADPDRTAATWVLSIGGTIKIVENGKEREIKAVADLARGAFELTETRLEGLNAKVSDAGLANFKDCKNLIRLYLSDAKVSDAGLATFKDCKNLKHLGLSGTQVSDAGMADFKDCKNLTDLWLENTKIGDAGLTHFKNCKNLMALGLGWTQVSDAGMANFKDCKNLTVLRLYGDTKVSDVGLANFKGCKNLGDLNLAGIQVSDVGLAYFKDCKNLDGLNLENTQVSDAGMANFKDCKNLSGLILGNTRVSDVGMANFKGCKNLTLLRLNGTNVSDVGMANFKDCKNLSGLVLGHTRVSDVGMANFRDCKNLTLLRLNGTNVSDVGMANFKDCKNLIRLNLSGTKVSDAGLANLKDCNNLVRLTLSGTKVSDAGLANLKDCNNLTDLFLENTKIGDAGLERLAGFQKLVSLFVKKTNVTEAGVKKLAAAQPRCKIEWDGGVIAPSASPLD